MDQLANGQNTFLLAAVFGFLVFLAMAPAIIAMTNSPRVLTFYALVFCLLALIGSSATFAFGSIVFPMIAVPFFILMWLAAMICGMAARIQRANETKSDELAFRLLNNDSDRLHPPSKLEGKYRKLEPEYRPGYGPKPE